jgi:hypothetical protein
MSSSMKNSLFPVCFASIVPFISFSPLLAQPVPGQTPLPSLPSPTTPPTRTNPQFQSRDVINITVSQAKGYIGQLYEISVWRGAGTTISFIPLDEKIRKVWLDDPSAITTDFDSPLCGTDQGGNCDESIPLVVHLRRVDGLRFRNVPKVRTTLLTIVTETAKRQRNLYQFRVSLGSGSSEYSAIIINPDDQPGLIRLPDNRQVTRGAVEQGLLVAQSNGLIADDQGNTELRSRVTLFLALLEKGVEAPLAANQAGVSLSLISRLAELGSGSPNSTTPTPNGSPNPTPTPNALPALP